MKDGERLQEIHNKDRVINNLNITLDDKDRQIRDLNVKNDKLKSENDKLKFELEGKDG